MAEHQVQASVGSGGVNHYGDVQTVQTLINMCLPPPLRPIVVDGVVGPATIGAIEAIQAKLLKLKAPDGRIDPHGPTLRLLQAHAARNSHVNRLSGPTAPSTAPSGRSAAPRQVAPVQSAPRQTAPTSPQAPGGQAKGSVPPDVVAAAQAANRTWHIPASVTIAQWMVESGYGKHMPAGSNNPFGIKAAAGQPYVEANTREVVHGQSVMMVQRFRKFDSIADAFDQHGKLLATARPYAPARGKLPDPNAFADALTGVYATDPNYGTMLKAQIRSHDLSQYDH